jgi:hypothetical protein
MRSDLNVWQLILPLVAMCTQVAEAQEMPRSTSTARDIYIGCGLFVRGKDVTRDEQGHQELYSGAQCALYSLMAIGQRQGRRNGEDNRQRFCLPQVYEIRQEPTRAMAYAYIEFFESRPSVLADWSGIDAYMAGMISKWPCDA